MKRVLPLLLVLGSGLVWTASACSSDEADDDPQLDASTTTSGGSSSSSGRTGSSSSSSSSSSGGVTSSSSGGSSSSSSSSGGTLVDGGVQGQECVFTGNYGCNPGLRCECEGEVADCTCQPGPRGTGEYNAPCTDGNECESGFCVTGNPPADGGPAPYFCSQFCEDQAACDGAPLSECDTAFTNLCVAPFEE